MNLSLAPKDPSTVGRAAERDASKAAGKKSSSDQQHTLPHQHKLLEYEYDHAQPAAAT